MISSNEVIDLIKGFSLTERLKIVEEILKNIREESTIHNKGKHFGKGNAEPAILSFAGILDEKEAQVFISAVEESRK